MGVMRLLLLAGCFATLLSNGAFGDEVAGPTKDLCYLVVDRSGSISDKKLVQPFSKAVVEFVEKLEPETEVDLVFFSNAATTPRIWYPLDLRAKSDFSRYFNDNFKPGGETALYDTVADVLGRIKAVEGKFRRITVIILSDGGDNESKIYKSWASLEKLVPPDWVKNRKGFRVVWTTVAFNPKPETMPTPGSVIEHVPALDRNDIAKAFLPPPKAAFTAIPAKVKVNDPVLFALDDDLGITSVKWSFGDGQSSAKKSDTHVFGAKGTYDVSVQVEGPSGKNYLEKKGCIQVVDEVPLEASFSWYPISVRVNEKVKFVDESLGSPTSWSWNFPPGSGSTERSPTASFGSVGKVSITLTVERDGKKHSATQVINVLPLPPDSACTVEPDVVEVGQVVRLKATKTESGWIHKWIVGSDVVLEGPQAEWKADRKGRVDVVHSVTGPGGTVESPPQSIFVGEKPPELVARFRWSPKTVRVGEQVQFIDDSMGAPKAWTWDIPIIGALRDRNPSVSFARPGKVTITLTIDREGNSNSAKQELEVLPALPDANFTADPAELEVGQILHLKASKTESNWKHQWKIADDVRLEGPESQWKADRVGRVEVVHTVVGPSGSADKSFPVFVKPKPDDLIARFRWSPETIHVGETVQLVDESLGSPKAWTWDINGKSMFRERNPSHIFPQAGKVTIKLVVEQDDRHNDIQRELEVLPRVEALVAKFKVSPNKGRSPLTVQFTDESTGEIASWYWEFGDGQTSDVKNPSHVYAKVTQDASYTPRLTIRNSKGDPDAHDAGGTTIAVYPPLPWWVEPLLWVIGSILAWIIIVVPYILRPLLSPQEKVAIRGTSLNYLKPLARNGKLNFLWPRGSIRIGSGDRADIKVGGARGTNEILARVARTPMTSNYTVVALKPQQAATSSPTSLGGNQVKNAPFVPRKQPRQLRDGDQFVVGGTVLTWVQPSGKNTRSR